MTLQFTEEFLTLLARSPVSANYFFIPQDYELRKFDCIIIIIVTPFLSPLSSCRNAFKNWLFLSDKVLGWVTKRVLWMSTGGVDGWVVPWKIKHLWLTNSVNRSNPLQSMEYLNRYIPYFDTILSQSIFITLYMYYYSQTALNHTTYVQWVETHWKQPQHREAVSKHLKLNITNRHQFIT